MIQPFTSFLPPGLVFFSGKTYIVPRFIEVPAETTLTEVYAAWKQDLPAPGPGMYCSTEDLRAYLNGTYKKPNPINSNIVENVLSSKGDKTYSVEYKNGTWSCTCTGFSYRKRCRHITETKERHNIKDID